MQDIFYLNPGDQPLSRQLSYFAKSAVVDNYTADYVNIEGGRPCPPYTVGWVTQFTTGRQIASASLVPSSGTPPAPVTPTSPAFNVILTYTDQIVPLSNGVSLTPLNVTIGSITGTVQVNVAGQVGALTVQFASAQAVTVNSGSLNATVAGSLVISGTPNVNVQGSQVSIVGGISGAALGDVGAPTLAIDQLTETISVAGGVSAAGVLAIASFKAAAGQTINKVQIGAFTTVPVNNPPNNLNITPPFAQNTVAGNFVFAWVSVGSANATTGPAGWTKVLDTQGLATAQNVSLWYKANCLASEANPTFNNPQATTDMYAQVIELSGVATVAPLDQSGFIVWGAIPSMTAVAGGLDAAPGDVVLGGSRWILNGAAAAATFSDTYNNNATAVQAGQSGPDIRASNFTYAIIPPFKKVLPVGVQVWPYDVSGIATQNQNGVAASIVLAATPGKAYICASISATFGTASALAASQHLALFDGASKIWSTSTNVPATAFTTMAPIQLTGLAYKGTAGNSMTLQWDGAGTQDIQDCNIGTYLR